MDSCGKATTYPNIEPPVLYPVNVCQQSKIKEIFYSCNSRNRWKKAIRDYWTYDKPISRKKGRLPITKAMKLLIKKLKIENYLWG